LSYNKNKIRFSDYRPFIKQYLYFDKILNQRRYQQPKIFSKPDTYNITICVSGIAHKKLFSTMIVNKIPCLDMIEKTQCFPLYSYNEDGTGKKENISDWALEQFREFYGERTLSPQPPFPSAYGKGEQESNKNPNPSSNDDSLPLNFRGRVGDGVYTKTGDVVYEKKQNINKYELLKEPARELRKKMTLSEKLIWEKIRNRQVLNKKFLRQKIIGRFIADFYCDEIKLIVEIDGDVHEIEQERDLSRDSWLSDNGYNIVRFKNSEIEKGIDQVLEQLIIVINKIENSNQQLGNPNPPSNDDCLPLNFRGRVWEGVYAKTGDSVSQEITKEDIFYYIYSVLHLDWYRETYKENLKIELPRIPKLDLDFHKFSKLGRALAELHLNYEDLDEYEGLEVKGIKKPVEYQIKKMRFIKTKKDTDDTKIPTLYYNDSIEIDGFPEWINNYKVGNRSPVEWVVDQYKDWFDEENPTYVIDLLKKLVTLTSESIRLINEINGMYKGEKK